MNLLVPVSALAVTFFAATPPADSPAGVGTVRGVIRFEGAVPEWKAPKAAADPACPKNALAVPPIRAAKDGALAGTMVRLPPGAARGLAVEEDEVITHRRCRKEPAMVVIGATGTLALENADPTLHNARGVRIGRQVEDPAETVFNLALPPGSSNRTALRSAAGSILRVACDVHPGEESWVVTTDHPFVAITGEDGAFSLDFVPAGRYRLEAFHPALGWQSVEIDVLPGKSTSATIVFRGSGAK